MEQVELDQRAYDIVEAASNVRCSVQKGFLDPEHLPFWLEMTKAWLQLLEPVTKELAMTPEHINDTMTLRLVIVALETRLHPRRAKRRPKPAPKAKRRQTRRRR